MSANKKQGKKDLIDVTAIGDKARVVIVGPGDVPPHSGFPSHIDRQGRGHYVVKASTPDVRQVFYLRTTLTGPDGRTHSRELVIPVRDLFSGSVSLETLQRMMEDEVRSTRIDMERRGDKPTHLSYLCEVCGSEKRILYSEPAPGFIFCRHPGCIGVCRPKS